jgi:hypothetical protein
MEAAFTHISVVNTKVNINSNLDGYKKVHSRAAGTHI